MYAKKLLVVPDRLRRLALLLIVVALGAAGAVPTPAWADAERLIAIGDLHGDYDAYRALLTQAGLIDAKGHWSGKKAVFVQMGDAVDRGTKSRDIVLDLQRLQKEASHDGGQVIALIGNHEAMNMTGDLRYVAPAEYQNFVTPKSEAVREQTFQANKAKLEAKARQDNPQVTDAEIKAAFMEKYPLGYFEQRLAWMPNGELGRWVVTNPAVAVVGDSLFVHGGISTKYAALTVAQINEQVQAALKDTPGADKAILEDEVGPLWYRGLTEETEASKLDVAAALKAYGVKRIVIAHTPHLSGIQVLHDGHVIMVDTGIMHAYGGTHSFLSIEGGTINAHNGDAVTELKAAENPAAAAGAGTQP